MADDSLAGQGGRRYPQLRSANALVSVLRSAGTSGVVNGTAFPTGVSAQAQAGIAVASNRDDQIWWANLPRLTYQRAKPVPATVHGHAVPRGVSARAESGRARAAGVRHAGASVVGVFARAQAGVVRASGVRNPTDEQLAMVMLLAHMGEL